MASSSADAVVSVAIPTSRRLVIPCWSHHETLALLDAFRDKWFALRRGNLRAADWQDVASDVALRSPSSSPPKTPLQCRHKIEKLRKRFRSERQKSLLSASSWAYFAKMEAMERGEEDHSVSNPPPSNISPNLRHASPFLTRHLPPRPPSSSDDDEDNYDESDGIDLEKYNNQPIFNSTTRSAHTMMPKLSLPKSGHERIPSPSIGGGHYFRGYGGEMRRVVDKREKRKEREEPSAMGELASALRVLGDGFLRMEYMKMESAREMEKMRMEMELKRTEMILDSQRSLVDAFVNGLFHRKKAKITTPEE